MIFELILVDLGKHLEVPFLLSRFRRSVNIIERKGWTRIKGKQI